MRDGVTTRLRSKLPAIQLLNSWNTLPGEVVELGFVHKFKVRLDGAGLSVFGEDNI